VLGCGPDLVYPPENAKLAAMIVEQGAVVTEFAPGVQPEASNFRARNRLISGLSLGVLVTEAQEASGALITTRVAAEQGRAVFAVPGNATSRGSLGCNRLQPPDPRRRQAGDRATGHHDRTEPASRATAEEDASPEFKRVASLAPLHDRSALRFFVADGLQPFLTRSAHQVAYDALACLPSSE